MFQLPNGEQGQFFLVCEQIARFRDNGRVAIERSVRFAGCFDSSVVLGRDVGHREPLGFTIDTKKRLIPGVAQFKETIGAFLDRRRSAEAAEQE